MIRKLLTALGIVASAVSAAPPQLHTPYEAEAANTIYNLLFCDDLSAFVAKPGEKPALWQRTLASTPIDIAALEKLAGDPKQEGRVRFLAYQRLRVSGRTVPAKQLLGVIFEVPQDGGLDALAAYSDGSARYINQSGKLVVADGVPALQPLVAGVLAAAQPLVTRIGPWDAPRLPPPTKGKIRMTFLVSDGLYFGEGPMTLMQNEPMAAPLIKQATKLLQAIVEAGIN